MDSQTLLVLNGSPRRNGNCNCLLTVVLEGVKSILPAIEVVRYNLYDLQLKPCVHCDGCLGSGKCVVRDDMDVLDKEFHHMHGLIVAAPIYFSHLCAQTKMMVDRCQPYWVAKYILQQERFPAVRPGLFVAAGGQPPYNSQFTGSSHTMRLLGKMLNADFQQELLTADTDRHPVEKAGEKLEEAYQQGVALARGLMK